MALLAIANMRYSVGQDVILDGATLTIDEGERIGLVGRNGTGKTTLLRVIADELKPDIGNVTRQKSLKVGYLRQTPDVSPGRTLREEAASAFDRLNELHQRLEAVFKAMEADPNPDELDRLMHQQADLQRDIDALGGYAVDHRLDAVLHGLSFEDHQFEVPVVGLSGGQLGRLALAKLLLDPPDLLLLDEPTNHLDIAGREWLETFIADEFRGAVLLVSHDRYLLDRVTHRIVEVEQGRLIDYPGNYSAFRRQRADRKLTQARAYEKQQAKFKREEAFIRKFKAGQRAKQARGRETRLEREKDASRIERPLELESFSFKLPEAPRTGELVVTLRNASAWHDDDNGNRKTLFKDLTLTISRGERWGIIGPNGAGKTSLVRCMLDQQPLNEGTATLGTNLRIGYFAQLDHDMKLDANVYRYLQDVIRKENPDNLLSEQQARDLAGAFLFSGADQERPLGELSGGERARARLAGLLASAKNLLVLDEPTNHLDIPSAERLEEAIKIGEQRGGFGGTLLLISHDRALIDATCDHLIILDGHGNTSIYHGSYSQWHDRTTDIAPQRTSTPPKQPRTDASPPNTPPPPTPGQPAKTGRKSSYSWMPTEQLEKEIETHEAKLKELDAQLATEEIYSDAEKCRTVLEQREQLQETLGAFEEEWLSRLDG